MVQPGSTTLQSSYNNSSMRPDDAIKPMKHNSSSYSKTRKQVKSKIFTTFGPEAFNEELLQQKVLHYHTSDKQ